MERLSEYQSSSDWSVDSNVDSTSAAEIMASQPTVIGNLPPDASTVLDKDECQKKEFLGDGDADTKESNKNFPTSNFADGKDQSMLSDDVCSNEQQSIEVKTWPFPRQLHGGFQTSNPLSRGSSEADFYPTESNENSKQAQSIESSECCSSSQSPLSYVIQLNEDSECSLPSEAGTSAVCPTGFDKILSDQVNHEAESVGESVKLDGVVSEHLEDDEAKSKDVDVVQTRDGGLPSAGDELNEQSTKSSKNRSKRIKKVKAKEGQDDNDQKSQQSVTKTRHRKCLSTAVLVENAQGCTDADGKRGVFEYQWPPDDRCADWYLLQEHISQFLGVVSFKRKYPDISRRVVDMHERDFLQEQGVVSEMQCDLGLTALLADEVYDVMERDYPEKFQEYAKVIHKKEKQRAADNQKTSEVMTEKTKIETLMKKSLKSAAEFNASLMRELRQERRSYFDLQTLEVHYPRSMGRILPKEATAISSHPLALIPGQFQDFYKRYSPAELNYFPLNTALYSPHRALTSVFAERNVMPVAEQTELVAKEGQVTGSTPVEEDEPIKVPEAGLEEKPIAVLIDDAIEVPKPVVVEEEITVESSEQSPAKKARRVTNRKRTIKQMTDGNGELQHCRIELSRVLGYNSDIEHPVTITCSVCDKEEKDNARVEEELVMCSSCSRSAHPTCLDLTNEMIPIIKTYNWQCMECKACVKCMKPHDEEKMMFCDHCDRGYHTFCVGVSEIPEGRWECPSCTLQAATPPPPVRPKRGRPFKYPRPIITT